jgi:hypothetical protein
MRVPAIISALLLVSAANSSLHAQQPVTGEQVNAWAKCQDAEAASPEAFRLKSLGIITATLPTAPQLFNNQYATPADSGMAMMYVTRMQACDAPLHFPPDALNQKFYTILTGFANGLLTYGDTAALMGRLTQEARAQLARSLQQQ